MEYESWRKPLKSNLELRGGFMAIDLRKIDPNLSYPLRQVAEFLNVSYGTVLKLKNDANFRPIKVGKRYYIQGRDILAYVRKG